MKSQEKLNKIFVVQVIAFLIAILAIAYLMFYQLSVNNLENRIISDFKAELELLSKEVAYKVAIAEENVKALSSRTMIRQELFSYHQNNTPLEEVRSYTQQKYVDGASVYKNILFARRTDVHGTTIAEYTINTSIIPKEYTEEYIKFIETNEGYHLFIRNRIIHEGTLIGYDTAAFSFNSMFHAKGKHINDIIISQKKESVLDLSHYTLSFPIGKTGFFIKANLNQEIVKKAKGNIAATALLLSILFFVSVLIVSYFTILRMTLNLLHEREKTNESLNRSLKENKFLLKELHHRVKNNLNLISAFINMQSSDTDDSELIERNKVLQNRINAISLVHEKLQAADDSLDVEIGTYLEDLCGRIIYFYKTPGVHLSVQKNDTPILPAKTAISLGLIFSELTMNSIKHGLPGPNGALRILITIEKKEKTCTYTYSDDGRPFPSDFDIKTNNSIGMMIIQNLTDQIDGTLEYNLSENKEIKITIPSDSISSEKDNWRES